MKKTARRPPNSLKRSRVAGAIVFALRQADTDTVVAEMCRKMGISEATFYNWNRGGGPQEIRWLRRTRASAITTTRSGRRAEENNQLKQLVAEWSATAAKLGQANASRSNQKKALRP